jgi:hypothetical protein
LYPVIWNEKYMGVERVERAHGPHAMPWDGKLVTRHFGNNSIALFICFPAVKRIFVEVDAWFAEIASGF